MIANLALSVVVLLTGSQAQASAFHDLLIINEPEQIIPPRSEICWGSKCRKAHGERTNFGQFKVSRDSKQEKIDSIVMEINNETDPGKSQVLVDASTGNTCDNTLPTYTSCHGSYQLKNVKVCPASAPNYPNCAKKDLIKYNIPTLDEVNILITGGSVVAPDGQVVSGLVTKNFWLEYKVCCAGPENFGSAGDILADVTTLHMKDENAQCTTETPKMNSGGANNQMEEIPGEPTPLCEAD